MGDESSSLIDYSDVAVGLTESAKALIPGPCHGAARFNTQLTACLLFTLIIPLGALLPLALHLPNLSQDNRTIIWAVMGVMIGLGVLWFFFKIRKVFCGGLCCQSKPPPKNCPFEYHMDPADGKLQLKKVIFIVNPRGGSGRNARIARDQLLPIFEEFGVDVEYIETQRAGHLRDLAREKDLTGIDAVFAMGGDGSFHEVINGMVGRSDRQVPVALVPAGSGNAVAHTLGAGNINPVKTVRKLLESMRCQRMDLNKVIFGAPERPKAIYAGMTLCWGLVGDIGITAEVWRDYGPLKYLAAAWGGLARAHNASPMRIEMRLGKDAKAKTIEGNFITVFVQTTQHFGEGYWVSPEARLDDGLLDLVAVRHASRGDFLQLFLQLPRGTHMGNKHVEVYKISSAVLTPDHGGHSLVNIDGEIVEFQGPMRIETARGVLKVMVPRDDDDLPSLAHGSYSGSSGSMSSNLST